MEKTLENKITIIQNALDTSMSYGEYRLLVQKYAKEKMTTGEDQSEALVNYTKLNDARMRRWDKTVKISEEIERAFSQYKNDVTWIVITESWCGDAAHAIPVISKLAEMAPNIDFKIVLRDENQALMNQFLTNGGQSIPKLIAVDLDAKVVIGDWGPRPTKATQMVVAYKQTHGALTPAFKEDLQSFYNKDKGQNIMNDLLHFIS